MVPNYMQKTSLCSSFSKFKFIRFS